MSSAESVLHTEEIEARALEAFEFLQARPTIGRHRGARSTLTYVLPELVVEVELNLRRSGVRVLVGGDRQLTELIQDTGHADQIRATYKLRWGEESMLAQLTAYAAALQSALPELPRLLRPA